MKVAHLIDHGHPPDVVEIRETPDAAPGPGEVLVKVMACGINPADLLGFEGRYPGPSPLPAPCGIEGAGIVEAVGDEVSLAPGEHVILMPRANWADFVVTAETNVVPIPAELPWADAAQLKINPPTAAKLLNDYVDLKPGDWVIQNAANSAVGLHLIRFAKEMGVKTANIVRREELIDPLMDHGADLVLLGGEDQSARLRAEIGDAPAPLGIDAMGGAATRWMADAVSDGGTIVNYGYLAGGPCEIEPGHLIVRGQTLTGFWLAGWMGSASPEQKAALFAEMSAAFLSGRIVSPVEATYELDDIAAALAHAWRGGRGGKILLTPNGPIQ